MGPCVDLISADDILSCCSSDQFDDTHPPSDSALDYARAVASTVAWRLGGRVHGACPVVGERPGRLNRRNICTSGLSYPHRVDGVWVNTGCSCAPASVVTLGNAPIMSIEDVRIGGVPLSTDAYALIPPNRLVRRDGGRWPSCQLLQLPDDAADVLVVDYTWGVTVGDGDRRAIGRLGCELVKACLDLPCRLPQRVQTITRQGVSMTLIDPLDFLDEGRTGVYEFDLWLSQVNPNGLHRRSRVRTPDIARPVVTHAQGT